MRKLKHETRLSFLHSLTPAKQNHDLQLSAAIVDFRMRANIIIRKGLCEDSKNHRNRFSKCSIMSYVFASYSSYQMRDNDRKSPESVNQYFLLWVPNT